MSAGEKKEKWFSQLSTLECLLSVFVPTAAFLAVLIWTGGQPLKLSVPAEGVIELRENSRAIVAAAIFSVLALVFCVAVLILRRRLGKLTLAALMTGFFGISVGGIGAGNATKSVVTFAPTGVTISAPTWLGGATQTKLEFAQIEWLRQRETVRWERDWVPRRVIGRLMTGDKPGWRQVTTDERFIKLRGGEEAEVTLPVLPLGSWHEIFKALHAAGVPIKPIERIVLPQPPD